MKRRWCLAAAGTATLAAGIAAGALLLRPSPPGDFPLADLVPADAVFYAGFPDLESLERAAARLPCAWVDSFRTRIGEARPHLAGEAALYVDREFEWVFLARLRKVSSLLADVPVEDGAAVIAGSPGALERRRRREGSLAGLPEFRALRSRLFLNLEALLPAGRLRDFTAAGFEIEALEPDLVLRGRAVCRGPFYRLCLEHYVQAPRLGAPPAGVPAGAALVEHFPLLWDELLRALPPSGRETLEREAASLSRDFLEGRSLREFLGCLGPACGLAVVPTPHDFPAVAGWIDLADDAARDRLEQMLLKAARDAEQHARDRAREPIFELAPEGPAWRIRLPGPAARRRGEAFSPAWAFRGNRLVFATCASALDAAAPVLGEDQVALTVEVGPLLRLARSLAGYLADGAFWEEAERAGTAAFRQVHTPEETEALRRRLQEKHDPKAAEYELAKFLGAERSRMTVEEMERISKTERYREELSRRRAEIEAWAERLGWLERVTLRGRYTGEGLEFELRARVSSYCR